MEGKELKELTTGYFGSFWTYRSCFFIRFAEKRLIIKVPFRKFFSYSSILVVAYSSLMSILGFYSGVAFNTIWKYFKYGEIIIGITVILIVMGWLVSRKLSKKISGKIEKI